MDKNVLRELSYGLYAIGTMDGSRPTGCIVNTVIQITSENPVIAVSMNKDNFTYGAIKKTGRFSVSIISEKTEQKVIARLGFSSGSDTDKFTDEFKWEMYDGLPVVLEDTVAHMTADVLTMTEMETHYVILARVREARKYSDNAPMTYSYYHKVRRGTAPKNAPTYVDEKQEQNTGEAAGVKWVCSVCGYIYDGSNFEAEPDSYTCPVCGQPKSKFVRQ